MNTIIPGLLAELGELDGTRYLELHAVVAVRRSRITPLCTIADWPQSAPALALARRARIATLEAELAALRAEERAVKSKEEPPDDLPSEEELIAAAEQPSPPPVPADAAPAGVVTCPDCGKTFKGKQGLAIHRGGRKCARAAAPPFVIDDDEPISFDHPPLVPLASYAAAHFRCAQCGSDAFAPSLHQPSICIKCAAAAARNGSAEGAARCT